LLEGDFYRPDAFLSPNRQYQRTVLLDDSDDLLEYTCKAGVAILFTDCYIAALLGGT